ncbi:MAG: bifunctional ornithine acetyltransferase/N-acetylglutamate synthase, partial [Pseudomonadota bacterium]
MDLAVSPLAPKMVPNAPALAGVGLYAAEAGIKYRGRTDVLLITFDRPARVAGVFTKSRCPSAPVDWCRQVLPHGKARAVLINAGNANAFTGMKGWEAVRLSAEMVADTVGCPVNEVYLASTGVIGEPLDAASFEGVLRRMGNGEGKADL